MDSYSKSIVAFMDILGFKNIINTEGFEKVRQIFSTITLAKNSIVALRKAVYPTESKNAPMVRYNDILLKTVKIHIMSDSIVVASLCQSPQALGVVIDICMMIQQMLFDLETPIFLRGAITKGDLYADNSMVFGKALVDAYIAQEYYAEYPRIILSDEVQRGMDSTILQDNALIRDEDGYWYINVLERFINYPFWDGLENNPQYNKLKNKVDQQLSGYADPNVRKKYLWLDKKLQEIEFKASCF